jgi:energy-coupling factor transporter ATP-binding protein EcfA2
MKFPTEIISQVDSHNGKFERTLLINSGFTVILGPNGSGKTHLLRGMKRDLEAKVGSKKAVRFMSAGRLGPQETYRSDFDGHRGSEILYESAHFGSKNDIARRHKIETLNGDFQTLSERVDILLMIQERLRKLLRRNVEINWHAGELRIDFSRTDAQGKPYSSSREASGLLHLVGMLSALYDDEIGALLIDEPEVSLHPQLQAFLLSEMRRLCGVPESNKNKKIIVIATHSTEMVHLSSAADLPSIIFCDDLRNPPVQLSANLGELRNKKIQNLIARLGQEHKLALFSRRPLIVEGPSDVIVCSTLSRRLNLHLEAAGSQLLPAIGTGQMPIVVKFLRMLGKTPVVLADADAMADGLDLINEFLSNNPEANRLAEIRGFKSAPFFAKTVYESFCQAVEAHWPTLEAHATAHPYWINKKADDLSTKRRAIFGTLFSVDPATTEFIKITPLWHGVKSQLISLLEFLETLGCFILRRGSIECYYQISNPATSIEKPSAAVEEMVQIESQTESKTRADYGDIVRCIEHASQAQKIIEAELLRDMILSIASPAMANLSTDFDTVALQNLARTTLRERASLFGLSIEKNSIVITLESKVLNVKGFPLVLRRSDNLIELVNKSLGLSST